MPIDFTIVGEVERRYLVPLGDHAKAAFGPCRLHMLFKGIEIAYRGRFRNGGKQDNFRQRVCFPPAGRDKSDPYAPTLECSAGTHQALGITQQFKHCGIVKLDHPFIVHDTRMSYAVRGSKRCEFHVTDTVSRSTARACGTTKLRIELQTKSKWRKILS